MNRKVWVGKARESGSEAVLMGFLIHSQYTSHSFFHYNEDGKSDTSNCFLKMNMGSKEPKGIQQINTSIGVGVLLHNGGFRNKVVNVSGGDL